MKPSVLQLMVLGVIVAFTIPTRAAVYRRNSQNCDSSSEEDDCEPPRSPVCKLKPAEDICSYFEFVSALGWTKRDCVEGTAFSIKDCDCTVLLPLNSSSDKITEKTNIPTPVPCTRKAAEDRKFYLQFIEGKGWEKQPCATGTAYNVSDCACTTHILSEHFRTSEGELGRATPAPCNRKACKNKTIYLEFQEGKGWQKQPCSKGTSFSASQCACTASLREEDTGDSDEDCGEKPTPEPCQRKPAEENNAYLEFIEGKGWIKRPCPEGTGFNAVDCACSISLPQEAIPDTVDENKDVSSPKPEFKNCAKFPYYSKKYYLQFFDGVGWVRLACVNGTVFSTTDCNCSSRHPGKESERSKSSSEEDSNEDEKPQPTLCTSKPGNSEKSFLQFVEGRGWVEQLCAKGTVYSFTYCDCMHNLPEEDDSRKDIDQQTNVPCSRKPCEDKKAYLQFIEGKGWEKQPCPKGTAYSAENCACSITIYEDFPSTQGEEDVEKVQNVPCTRKPHEDKTSYLQFIEGKGWQKQPCPKGTAYNSVDCACSVSVTPEEVSISHDEKESHGKPEPVSCTLKSSNNTKVYFQFIEGQDWVKQFCRKWTAFSAKDCACSIYLFPERNEKKDEHVDVPESESCPLEADDDHRFFWQTVEGQGRVKFACAKGTAFNQETCDCSTFVLGKTDSDDNKEEKCVKKEKISPTETNLCILKATYNRKSYLEFMQDQGWVYKFCMDDAVFNPDLCTCH